MIARCGRSFGQSRGLGGPSVCASATPIPRLLIPPELYSLPIRLLVAPFTRSWPRNRDERLAMENRKGGAASATGARAAAGGAARAQREDSTNPTASQGLEEEAYTPTPEQKASLETLGASVASLLSVPAEQLLTEATVTCVRDQTDTHRLQPYERAGASRRAWLQK